MLDLAQQLVRDGEGASKFVKITVAGAASEARPARSPAPSPNPPGQDRLRRRGRQLGPDRHGGGPVRRADPPRARRRALRRLVAAKDGAVSPTYDEAQMSAYMKRAELEVSVDVGVGRASASMWTCDLTKRYVEINGDYRS